MKGSLTSLRLGPREVLRGPFFVQVEQLAPNVRFWLQADQNREAGKRPLMTQSGPSIILPRRSSAVPRGDANRAARVAVILLWADPECRR